MGMQKAVTTEKKSIQPSTSKRTATKGKSEKEIYRGLRNFTIKRTEYEDIKGMGNRETNSKEIEPSTQRKHTMFWRGPKFYKENVIIIVCSFLLQQRNWKAIESARKTQCRLLF